MKRVPYASAVGSLMYVILCARPDICFAVELISHYQSNLGPLHWQAIKRIFRYLHGSYDFVLCFYGGDLRLKVFCVLDWDGDRDECKSTLGQVFILRGGVVSWCSKKQTCITLSTTEAEYITRSVVVQEIVWLKRFMQCFGIMARAGKLVEIHTDSLVALAQTKGPKYHGRIKHIDIRFHYIRNMVKQGEVVLKHISTSKMMVNLLTKPITRGIYQSHVRGLGLRRI